MSTRRLPLLRLLAGLAVALNTAVGVFVWWALAGDQEIWPFPALYLLEMVALPLSVASMALFRPAALLPVAAGAAGAGLAFCFLGAFTVGFLYLPASVLVVAVAVLIAGAGGRSRSSWLLLIGAGALVQTLAMLGLVLYS